MPVPRNLRLSPSGPRVSDGVSGADLQIGDGSTGLGWRAQGTIGPWTTVPLVATPVPGLTLTWNLGAGYRYDLFGKALIKAPEPAFLYTTGTVTLAVEIEEAGAPGVWLNALHGGPIVFTLVGSTTTPPSQDDSRILRATNTLLDRSAALDITGLRLTLSRGAGPFEYLPHQCSVAVQQYILET